MLKELRGECLLCNQFVGAYFIIPHQGMVAKPTADFKMTPKSSGLFFSKKASQEVISSGQVQVVEEEPQRNKATGEVRVFQFNLKATEGPTAVIVFW